MEQPVVPAAEAVPPPLSPECGALRKAAVEKFWHLHDYLADYNDGSPHLPDRIVDYRSANVVVDETLAAYDAAATAGAPMNFAREHIENMRKGAQRAYARRMLSRVYKAAIARITDQADIGDPRTMLDEALKATEDIPADDHMLQGIAELKTLVMRACADKEKQSP